LVSFYDNSLISSFINRSGRDLNLNSWDSDPHMGLGSRDLLGGGMLYGPTEGSLLTGLVGGGSTGGSRAILSGMTRWTGMGGMGGMNYSQGAMGGIMASANHFAFGGGPLWSPLPVPVFQGMAPAPAPSASSAAGAPAAPASTLSATTPQDAADVDKDAEEISDLREKYENAEHGYTEEEMGAILDAAEEASGEDSAKYKRILKDLPDKKFVEKFDDKGEPTGLTIDQQRANWVKNFGKWYAEKIGGVDGGKAAQLVKDVASGEGVTYDLELAQNKKAFKKYTVKGVEGQGELKDGDALFYNPEDNKFYSSYSKKERFQKPVGKASESIKDGKKTKKSVSLEIGGGVDYIELTPAGVHKGSKPMGDGHTKLFDRYVVGEAFGEEANEAAKDIEKTGGEYYVFYDEGSKKWFYNPEGEDPIKSLEGADYVDGRLYFNKGGSYDGDLADDAAGYMKKLDGASEELAARLEKIEGASEEQDKLRAEAALGQLEEMMGEEAYEKAGFSYDAEKDLLTATCDEDDCQAVVDALKDGEVAEGEEADGPAESVTGEAILSELPEKTEIQVNPESKYSKPFSTKVKPFEKLVEEFKSEAPKEIKIEKEISLKHLKGATDPAEAVAKHLKNEIEQQNKKIHNPTAIVFEGEVKFPEGVDEANCLMDISNKYESIELKFSKVTLPNGTSFQYTFKDGKVVSSDEVVDDKEAVDSSEAAGTASSDAASEASGKPPAESKVKLKSEFVGTPAFAPAGYTSKPKEASGADESATTEKSADEKTVAFFEKDYGKKVDRCEKLLKKYMKTGKAHLLKKYDEQVEMYEYGIENVLKKNLPADHEKIAAAENQLKKLKASASAVTEAPVKEKGQGGKGKKLSSSLDIELPGSTKSKPVESTPAQTENPVAGKKDGSKAKGKISSKLVSSSASEPAAEPKPAKPKGKVDKPVVKNDGAGKKKKLSSGLDVDLPEVEPVKTDSKPAADEAVASANPNHVVGDVDLTACKTKGKVFKELDALVKKAKAESQPGDTIIFVDTVKLPKALYSESDWNAMMTKLSEGNSPSKGENLSIVFQGVEYSNGAVSGYTVKGDDRTAIGGRHGFAPGQEAVAKADSNPAPVEAEETSAPPAAEAEPAPAAPAEDVAPKSVMDTKIAEAKTFVTEGKALEEKGDYKGAVKEYKKAKKVLATVNKKKLSDAELAKLEKKEKSLKDLIVKADALDRALAFADGIPESVPSTKPPVVDWSQYNKGSQSAQKGALDGPAGPSGGNEAAEIGQIKFEDADKYEAKVEEAEEKKIDASEDTSKKAPKEEKDDAVKFDASPLELSKDQEKEMDSMVGWGLEDATDSDFVPVAGMKLMAAYKFKVKYGTNEDAKIAEKFEEGFGGRQWGFRVSGSEASKYVLVFDMDAAGKATSAFYQKNPGDYPNPVKLEDKMSAGLKT
jgi:hypothetical protein